MTQPKKAEAKNTGNVAPLKEAKRTEVIPNRLKSFPSDLDARDLPPFKDPYGREITRRHRRRAMRRATRMELSPVDENHALYLLAENDVDIIDEDASLLEHALKQKKAADQANALMVPETGTELLTAPSVNKKSAEDIAAERETAIAQIQRDLVGRRRRRLAAMLLRLAVMVFLPTAIVGHYFFNIATPMYETESEFVIQTSDNPAASGGIGGFLAGTGFATSQDSIVVQSFLSSREAFLRLERDHGYTTHFMHESIDPIQRLPADASLDEAYIHFTDRVTIGYDPTEGVIRMAVVAATPEASQQFSEALVAYAETRVDGLSQEARGDQLDVATARYNEAEEAMLNAQQRVLTLQQQRGVLSAEVELSSQMSIINALELEAENKRLALAEILDNAQAGTSRASVLMREIERLDERVEELRADLTQTSDSTVSLARISAELRIAESELATRQLILQESIASMETARLEANRQVRYLSLGVAPVAPIEPTYPRKVEGTALAFVIFMAIYILLSLTVSILREQVSV